MRFAISLLLFCTLYSSVPASSQVSSYPVQPLDLNSMFISNMIAKEDCENDDECEDDSGSRPRDEVPNSEKLVTFDFAVEPHLRRNVTTEIFNYLKKDNALVVAQLEQIDIFVLVQPEMVKYQLDTNSLLDTTTLFAWTLWEAANEVPASKRVSVEDKRSVVALQQGLYPLLYSNRKMLKSGPNQIQRTSDQFVILSFWIALNQQAAWSNESEITPAILAKEAAEVGQFVFGIDLRDVDLTEAGFVPRDRDAFAEKYANRIMPNG